MELLAVALIIEGVRPVVITVWYGWADIEALIA